MARSFIRRGIVLVGLILIVIIISLVIWLNSNSMFSNPHGGFGLVVVVSLMLILAAKFLQLAIHPEK